MNNTILIVKDLNLNVFSVNDHNAEGVSQSGKQKVEFARQSLATKLVDSLVVFCVQEENRIRENIISKFFIFS